MDQLITTGQPTVLVELAAVPWHLFLIVVIATVSRAYFMHLVEDRVDERCLGDGLHLH